MRPHEFDPFMETQLKRLLEFHAMLGGSAIVMTATLPLGMRDGYAKAFQQGMGIDRPQGPMEKAYPTLTVIGKSGMTSNNPRAFPATCRNVSVHRLADAEAAREVLKCGVERGAACVWIRDSVDDAIAAYHQLREVGVEADLLHARFALADRLRHERALQRRFGREGIGREGRVLVATQVVESSLDLDFDVMVSDLAPVGSLIQRTGRLWRHMDLRPKDRRPVDGPALHVLAPNPEEVTGRRWLHGVIGSGAWVYPQDVQWRTAQVLFKAGEISVPVGLRKLIEAVYSDDRPGVPEALEEDEFVTEGRKISEEQQAFNQVIDAADAYDQPQLCRIFDDDRFPTRLGIPQVTLRLAQEREGSLVPWAGDDEHGWLLSEVQVSKRRFEKLSGVDQEQPAIKRVRRKWPKWTKYTVQVVPVGDGGRICEGLRYDPAIGIEFRS